MSSALEVNNLKKHYEGFTLDDVSFSIPAGYIMGLIGPNGAGKTTIIKLIMGLLRPDGGDIRVFGQDSRDHEVPVKSRIGFVHDVPTFYGHLRLETVKSIIAPFYPQWDEARFLHLAGDFGLDARKKVKALSKGMRTKFALALALSHNADLLIMDEPTSGLDPLFRRELLGLFSELLQDAGKSILFSTHITTDLERIADYVTFVHEGRLVFSETRDEILGTWSTVKGGNDSLDDKLAGLLEGLRRTDYGFEGLTSQASAVRGLPPGDLVMEKATLEDIMYFVTKGEHHA
jgi:ABC-2 type transport system ATP-binding protein